jgi:cell division protein DivIC
MQFNGKNISFRIIENLPAAFRNKYVLTVLIFFLWILLCDSNNLISRYKDLRTLHKLRNEKEYYLLKIEEDKKMLHELKADDHNLEKFAREQYLMKKHDEDLFIVLTPREDRQIARKNN